MRFTKMQGCGNDYLFVRGEAPEDAAELTARLSDRHRGVGSDGVIFIKPADGSDADFVMRIFNADGSEAKMCGNGIRCAGRYVFDRGHTDKTEIVFRTNAGLRRVSIRTEEGKFAGITADMGIVKVSEPFAFTAGEYNMEVIPVDAGSPHAVHFCERAESFPLDALRDLSENCPRFSDKANAEAVQVIDGNTLRMRVWERGSGLTLACGTGASASAAAAVAMGYCRYDTDIEVRADGGILTVRVMPDGRTLLGGEALFVFDGETL